MNSEDKLDAEMGRLDLTSSLSGASLKAIATRFRTDHADNVAKADAGRIVEAKVNEFVNLHSNPNDLAASFRIHPDPQNLDYMKRLATMVAKSATVNVNANTDKETLGPKIAHRLRSFLGIVDVAINTPNPCWENRKEYDLPDGTKARLKLPLPVLNELSFKVFASCLFNRDGEMIGGSVAGMQLRSFPSSLLTGAVKDAVLNAEIPMDLVKTCNNAFLNCFTDPAAKFSDLHKGILDELRDEMVSRYGNAVDKNADVFAFGNGARMRELLEGVVQSATEAGRLVRASEIKDALRNEFSIGAEKMAEGLK